MDPIQSPQSDATGVPYLAANIPTCTTIRTAAATIAALRDVDISLPLPESGLGRRKKSRAGVLRKEYTSDGKFRPNQRLRGRTAGAPFISSFGEFWFARNCRLRC